MDLIKVEKERAMLRYLRLRRAAALSRWLLEFLAAVTLLACSSGSVQASITRFLSLLRQLLPSLLNPLSAFLIGNSIILALVLKSSGSPEDPPPPPPPRSQSLSSMDDLLSPPTPALQPKEDKDDEEVVICEDKAVCSASLVLSDSESEEEKELVKQEEEDAEEEEDKEFLCVPVEEDGDAFRRKIEAFIANQLSFIEREEESLLRQAKSIAASGDIAQC